MKKVIFSSNALSPSGSYAQAIKAGNFVFISGCAGENPKSNSLVKPGDIIFADVDGIVAIPKDIEDEVIKKALEKVRGENKVREELLAGVSVKEVFSKYHIL